MILGRLNPGKKVALYLGAGAAALALLCCGGITAVGALMDAPQQTGSSDTRVAQPARSSASSTQAAEAGVTPTAPASTAARPEVETRTVTETRRIPFKTRTVRDSSLAEGRREVRARGVDGVKTRTYEVTFTDGVETGRNLLRETVTRAPVTRVVAVGTKPEPRCHPSYSDVCVPIASDVDCSGGSGNGPAYVTGPVKVVGPDVYDLDRDGDGYGCD